MRLSFIFISTIIVICACSPASEITIKEGYVVLSDGYQLSYRTVGAGQDTLVIPAPWYIEGLAPDLEPLGENLTLLFFELRGRGTNKHISDTDSLTFEDDIRDMDEVREFFGLQKMSLMGYSFASLLASFYTLQYPDCIKRLILMGTSPPRSNPYLALRKARSAKKLDPEKIARLKELTESGLEEKDREKYMRAWWSAYAPKFFADTLNLTRSRSNLFNPPQPLTEFLERFVTPLRRNLGEWDMRSRLGSVTMPVLIIQGTEESFSIEETREWLTSLPNARLLVMKNVGHFHATENPDLLFPSITTFMKGEWPEGVESAKEFSVMETSNN